MAVIPPGSEAVITTMLSLPTAGATWWLRDWSARQTWIDARYSGLDGAWAVVRLVAPDRSVTARFPSVRTQSFIVVVVRQSGEADIDALLAALAANITRHEADFHWSRPRPPPAAVPPENSDPRDVSCERLALEAGVKPALRIRLHVWEAPYEAGIWLRKGFAVAAVELGAGADGAHTFVMVARTRDAVEALARAEVQQHASSERAQLDALRDCGRLLGYPPCCVEAFLRSIALERGRDARLIARRGNFDRLDAAWVPSGNRRLNTILRPDRLGLISFDPCRFDCAHASAAADRIAAAIERPHPGYDEHLRGVFAANDLDQRARLELVETTTGDVVRRATPIGDDAVDFARALVGLRVTDDGRVPDLGRPCRVFRFD